MMVTQLGVIGSSVVIANFGCAVGKEVFSGTRLG